MKLRIAFVTDEFISEKPNSGGLGNYLNRITQTLKDLGHEPEVFVIGQPNPAVINFHGIRVERVAPANSRWLHILKKLQHRFLPSPWGGPAGYLSFSLALAEAFKRRHQEAPFHFVQSANCSAVGLFLPSYANCPHLIRLSSKRSLWFQADGRFHQQGAKAMAWLERAALRKADIAYAPSAFVAKSCQGTWRDDVNVLRPPVFIETQADGLVPDGLPQRYLIHFGQIGPRKGSDLVAQALCHLWQQESDFKMLWAGRVITPGDFERCHQLWGEKAANVIWVGPVRKERLYTFLKNATAAVLPSRVDNLPNTVIESLMLGIPVIGSKGASIDELVEPGLNGELVEIGDVEALAEAMLKAWRQGRNWINPFIKPSIFKELEPKQAALNLIRLAGY